MTNTFIHSRSSLENSARFQAKRGGLHPFLDRNGEKTMPYRAALTFMAYIWKKAPLLPPSEATPGVLLYANFKSNDLLPVTAASRVVSTPMGMTKLECPLQVVGCWLVDGRLNTPEGSFSLVSVYLPILSATRDA